MDGAMGRSTTLLSKMLADVAQAVVSAQSGLDRAADNAPTDTSLAPLAFVFKETRLDLLGQMSMPAGRPSTADQGMLTFSQVGRVQAGLYGNKGLALTSRVSVSIRALEPKHAGTT
jgi:hypothetical protein